MFNQREKSKNKFFYLNNSTIKGVCPNGRYFLIDAEDRHLLKDYYWSADKYGYVSTIVDGKYVRLSRLIMNAPDGKCVDHINHKPFDNRKQNLRICTSAENSHNMTAFDPYGRRRGIKKRNYGFWVTFRNNGIERGKRFSSYEDAVRQRTEWEEEFFGEFAPWDRYDEKKNSYSKAIFCEDAPSPKLNPHWVSPYECADD